MCLIRIHSARRYTAKQELVQTIKSLNLFKNANALTEKDIKQQKMMTYVYLVSLIGMLSFSRAFEMTGYSMYVH